MRKNLIALSLFNAAKLLREQEEAAPAEVAAPEAASQDSIPKGKNDEPLTVESMIERLNVIRAGKSFDDPEVFGQLTTLYKGIENEKKTWLDSFLFNIGRIVQSVSEQPAAAKPELPAGPPAELPPKEPPVPPPASPPAPAAV
jgi:hypothetical protein